MRGIDDQELIDCLRAENLKLRAVLERIVAENWSPKLTDIARRALEEK